MHKYLIPMVIGVALLVGCGGGGGTSAPSASVGIRATPTNLAIITAKNVLPVSVKFGPAHAVNQAFASVTICAPGSSTVCQTIDDILIDTGSTGLRIPASLLTAVSLPAQTDASGNPVGECAQFIEGFVWGAVKVADVRLGGEQANSLPIQVIADPGLSSIPTGCSATGRSIDTVQTLGANGYLGIGAFRHDCGDGCANDSTAGLYYACSSSGCEPASMPLADQVTNPVSKFATDNNGIILQLPAVPDTGSASVDGTLVFGIGTQENNALGSASVLALSSTGGVNTLYKGDLLYNSIIDSGSNVLVLRDASIPACNPASLGAGLECPVSTQSLNATIQGMNGTNVSVNFSVGNADSLLTNGFAAFANLAAPSTWASILLPGFDWGLPFFFGRSVFVAIEGAAVPGAASGPFIAF